MFSYISFLFFFSEESVTWLLTPESFDRQKVNLVQAYRFINTRKTILFPRLKSSIKGMQLPLLSVVKVHAEETTFQNIKRWTLHFMCHVGMAHIRSFLSAQIYFQVLSFPRAFPSNVLCQIPFYQVKIYFINFNILFYDTLYIRYSILILHYIKIIIKKTQPLYCSNKKWYHSNFTVQFY